MFPEQRYIKIQQLLKIKGALSVNQIADELEVSLPTVRRDLAVLESKNLIKRTHGGALYIGSMIEAPFDERLHEFSKEKNEIAEFVVEGMIKPGDAIAIDNGTTTLEISREIRKKNIKNIKVITNSLRNAIELSGGEGIEVVISGGVLEKNDLTLVGSQTVKFLDSFHVDKVFLGISGIHHIYGFTDNNPEESVVKKEFLKIAREKIVVADHSKFGKVLFVKICDIRDVDCIITDTGLDKKQRKNFEKSGIKVFCI